MKARSNRWGKVRFGDIAQTITDRVDNPSAAGVERYVGLEHLDPDSLRIARWGVPKDVEATKLRFEVGDVIFGRRRAYQRKVALADFDGICSAHALVLRAKPDVVLPEFLPLFMQSDVFFDRALSISVGSLSPTINWRTLAKQEFDLPPVAEQKRIADVLWTAERCGYALIALHHSLNALESATLGALTSTKATHSWPRLGELARIQYGLTVNPARSKLARQEKYLRVANVHRGTVDLTEVKLVGCSQEDVARFALREADVLVVEGHADANEVGRAAVWEGAAGVHLHQNHILRVRCSDELDPRFLVSFINGPLGRRYFRANAKSTSGLHTINSSVLRNLPVLMLSTAEQKVVVEHARRIDAAKHQLEQHEKQFAQVKRQLLATMLDSSGTLSEPIH